MTVPLARHFASSPVRRHPSSQAAQFAGSPVRRQPSSQAAQFASSPVRRQPSWRGRIGCIMVGPCVGEQQLWLLSSVAVGSLSSIPLWRTTAAVDREGFLPLHPIHLSRVVGAALHLRRHWAVAVAKKICGLAVNFVNSSSGATRCRLTASSVLPGRCCDRHPRRRAGLRCSRLKRL